MMRSKPIAGLRSLFIISIANQVMSFKFLIPSLGVAAVVFSSCAPLTPYSSRPQAGPQAAAKTPEQIAAETKAAEQKKIADARAEAKRKAADRENTSPDTGAGSGGGSGNSGTPSKPDYRRAIPIPGKAGFVFNPFTNNPVDVGGIPSGTLVRDPQDPNPDHKFRVP